ncbi:hypothetical protein FA95DRAFT_1559826 [Auriscalpium vulgare]|uniref:Uncharacterized protein n=1 Tax=Auriscalpium vulgare TaxID=40419 RepID=A0ACB8RSI2_9AGAM|nr:hypothetical protein FA95DRAFT_1559826 [Auriscalpium vulgare]
MSSSNSTDWFSEFLRMLERQASAEEPSYEPAFPSSLSLDTEQAANVQPQPPVSPTQMYAHEESGSMQPTEALAWRPHPTFAQTESTQPDVQNYSGTNYFEERRCIQDGYGEPRHHFIQSAGPTTMACMDIPENQTTYAHGTQDDFAFSDRSNATPGPIHKAGLPTDGFENIDPAAYPQPSPAYDASDLTYPPVDRSPSTPVLKFKEARRTPSMIFETPKFETTRPAPKAIWAPSPTHAVYPYTYSLAKATLNKPAASNRKRKFDQNDQPEKPLSKRLKTPGSSFPAKQWALANGPERPVTPGDLEVAVKLRRDKSPAPGHTPLMDEPVTAAPEAAPPASFTGADMIRFINGKIVCLLCDPEGKHPYNRPRDGNDRHLKTLKHWWMLTEALGQPLGKPLRHQCPHCARTYSRVDGVQRHEKRCKFNPAVLAGDLPLRQNEKGPAKRRENANPYPRPDSAQKRNKKRVSTT